MIRFLATFVGFTACAVAFCAAPDQTSYDEQQQSARPHPRYKLVDMGTFGGPQSYTGFYARILNEQGKMVGWGDTSTPDPKFPNFDSCFNPDCLFSHAFQWQNGGLQELPLLPGGSSGNISSLSNRGLVVGVSTNGTTDPDTGQPEEIRAVIWGGGKIIDLGTLGGNESGAFYVNNQGQVVGDSANTVPDPFSFFGWATQSRGFLWEHGSMRDIGSLGGPDTLAALINERGEIAGCSYTNATPNATTGLPTTDPFLFRNGRMIDLGTLGGTFGCANAMNNLGEVAGDSNLDGDVASHPFLWDGKKMIDLGTFGGNFGDATYMNDSGEVVGSMNLPGETIHLAFSWKNGVLKNLGTLDKCSTAWGINSQGQIVGGSGDCGIAVRAFLWERGHMIDLTRLIPPGVELTYALNINDHGEIAALGRVAGCGDTGCQHAFLLLPINRDEGADTAVEPDTAQSPNAISPGKHAAEWSPQLRRKAHD